MGKKSRRHRARSKVKCTRKSVSLEEVDDETLRRMTELLVVLVSTTEIKKALAAVKGIYSATHVGNEGTPTSEICAGDTEGDRASRALVKVGGVEAIISFMRENQRTVLVALFGSCCAILTRVSVSAREECSRAIVQCGGIPIVLGAFRIFIEKFRWEEGGVYTCKSAISTNHALDILKRVADQHVTEILQAGGIKAVLSVLKNMWPVENAAIVWRQAMSVLHHIVLPSYTSGNAQLLSIVSQIVAFGGIPTIVARMKAFSDSRALLGSGCFFVQLLCDATVGGDPSAVLAAGGDEVIRMALEYNERAAAPDPSLRQCLLTANGLMNNVVPQCRNCGRQSEDMMVCNRCDTAWYCSNECLAGDWQNHNAACNTARWKPLNNVQQE